MKKKLKIKINTSNLRSKLWFDNENNPGMTALYIERYLNHQFTKKKLLCNKPIIGIAQTGSDLSPCNKIHSYLSDRVKEGIRSKVMLIINNTELEKRKKKWTPPHHENQTPWQEIYRKTVGQLDQGGCIELATKYQKIKEKIPRNSH